MKTKSQQVADHSFAILSVLASKIRLRGDVLVRRALRIAGPTLQERGPYGILMALERRQLIRSDEGRQRGRPNRMYCITNGGVRHLEAIRATAFVLPGRLEKEKGRA